MTMETCPLFDELDWIRHGFFGNHHDEITNALVGFHPFADYPRVLFINQAHTDTLVTETDDVMMMEADASFTTTPQISLAIKTADCCPILLACTHSRQIAAIHAGWRGALNMITLKTVNELLRCGAQPAAMIAAIGPSIQAETYPVQDDVRDKFAADQPEALSCFTIFEDRWIIDVPGIIQQQLTSAGVGAIWQSAINTFTDPDYSSYRRRNKNPENERSRNVSVICKTEA